MLAIVPAACRCPQRSSPTRHDKDYRKEFKLDRVTLLFDDALSPLYPARPVQLVRRNTLSSDGR